MSGSVWQTKVFQVILAMILSGVVGCESTRFGAPVLDRSLGSKPAPAVPVTGKRSTQPDGLSSGKNAVASTSSRSEPAESAASPEFAEASVKPYKEGDWRPEFYVVNKGDTLYSIALDHGEDYRDLAKWNHLEDPARIQVGQKIRLFSPQPQEGQGQQEAVPLPEPPPAEPVPVKTGPKARKLEYSEQALAQLKMTNAAATAPVPAPQKENATAMSAKPELPKTIAKPPLPASPAPNARPGDGRIVWEWPTTGKVLYVFGQGSNPKGLGIEGRVGQAVMAAAPGKVVYSGSGLRAYGKLIIIKHNASFLSVYAHGSQILVKEGQAVAKGQKIGEMGQVESARAALHFEIRRLGKPVDPLQFLPDPAS